MDFKMTHPQITIVLLNYKRPQNIPIILKAIREQTIKAQVFLWNNGGQNVNSPLIDRYEESTKNVGCMARWKLAKEALTPYVMSLDDDICFSRKDALENIITSLETQDNPNRIIGVSGACFGLIPIYELRQEFMCRLISANEKTDQPMLEHDALVDIVKGRVMAFRKKLLDGISLPEEREDDIYLSAVFSGGQRRFHKIPALLNNAFHELPEHGTGNYHSKDHYQSRDRALRNYYPTAKFLDNKCIRSAYLKIKWLLKRLEKKRSI